MCGGRGTRLDVPEEKPLYEVGDRPMVDRVCEALADSRIETIRAVGSPHTPQTRAHLNQSNVTYVESPGEGYVADLGYALDRVGTPVLTAAADLPLLAADAVDGILDAHADYVDEIGGPRPRSGGSDVPSLAVYAPAALKRLLGVSIDPTTKVDGGEVAPAGVNVVAGGDVEEALVTFDARLAVNVNRRADARVAEELR